jgi:hypothetical protein
MSLVSSKGDPDKIGPKDVLLYLFILSCVLGVFYLFQKAREWYNRGVDLRHDERKWTH